MNPILRVRNLAKRFYIPKGLFGHTIIDAVKPLSFSLNEGKTLAIIGHNGSGKSTLAKMIVGMLAPDTGDIWIDEQKIEYGDYRARCKLIRMIFQHVDSSFDPRLTVGQLLAIPLQQNTSLNKQERNELIYHVLKQVGLSADHIHYYPSVMAAGQKQRVAIARALILHPKVIIFDEALTALDISMRSQIINLMLSLQKEHNLSYIYVTQDIGMMKHISDQIIVMHEGELVEYGNTAEVLASPLSEVTQKMIQSYFGEALTADTWRTDTRKI